ncbi:formate--tetrahydrofolate ligase, partial [Arthrobacter deserti]|nr:formate--tetrahydrofolate ligase [Arthrobacter deserti]
VAVNRFATDSRQELDWVLQWCRSRGVEAGGAVVWAGGGGGRGGDELAAKVAAVIGRPQQFAPLYDLDLSVEKKIETIAQQIYGADHVESTAPAGRQLADTEAHGLNRLPVCRAKTQYSFTDDASVLGAPSGFTIRVRELIPRTGAGFIVALTGAVMTMPGLPKEPAALRMDVDDDGRITGLF